MNALDLAFPPGECHWQSEAESYVKYGTLDGQPSDGEGYWYLPPEMFNQAYSLA